jgi:hypothetical protein
MERTGSGVGLAETDTGAPLPTAAANIVFGHEWGGTFRSPAA